MTRLLQTYLKIAHEAPGNAELRRIVEREIAPVERALGSEIVHPFDGKIEPVRELLLSTAIESTTLVQTEMYRTVIEGAEPAICMRQAVTVLPMKDNTLTIPVGEVGSYAGEVAEGAEIPVDTEDYTSVTMTARKYGTRPLITKEMIEDSLYPVIEMQVRKAGRKLENRLNQLMLTEMLDNASNEHDCTGSNLGVKAVNSAIGLVKADGFLPDRVILSPSAEAVVMGEFVPSSYYSAETVANGRLPPMLGLQPFVCGVTDSSTTYAWEYDSDGDIGMLVFDSGNGPIIGMRRDITVSEYDDPIRDLRGMACTMRVGIDTIDGDAISRIEY